MIRCHDAWLLGWNKAGKSQLKKMAVVYPEISTCSGKFEKQVFSQFCELTYLHFFDDSFRRHHSERSLTLIMIFIASFDFTSPQFLTHKFNIFGKEISNNLLKFEADVQVYLALLRQVTRFVCRVLSFTWEPLRPFWTCFVQETDLCDTRGANFYDS